MDRFIKTFEVRWADMDVNRHLRHTAFNDYAAHVRVAYLAAHGFSPQKMAELNMGPVLFREETLFFKEVGMNEVITVDCQLAGLSHDGSRWRLKNKIFKETNIEAASITLDGAWIDLKSRRLTTPPAELAEIFKNLPHTEDFVEIPAKP